MDVVIKHRQLARLVGVINEDPPASLKYLVIKINLFGAMS
jgi:hypothetical protein